MQEPRHHIRPVRLFIRFIAFCASNFNEFLEKNGPYMSAAVSFYALFSLFPLFLALVIVFGLFLGIENFKTRLVEALVTQVPVLAGSNNFIHEVLTSIDASPAVTTTVAVAGLLWVSTGVFGSIRKSVNSIWGIKKTRPFVQERLMDFALMFGATSLLFASLYTTTLVSFISETNTFIFLGAQTSGSVASRLILGLLPPVLSFCVFLVLYWWLPNIKLHLRHVVPTALGGALAFEAAKFSFVFYLRAELGPETLYGQMGAVIILMAWVYVSAIILLVGAQLTARYTGWIARREQLLRNEVLSRNLERVRLVSTLPGLTALPQATYQGGLPSGNGSSGDGAKIAPATAHRTN
jgi:membrane protein